MKTMEKSKTKISTKTYSSKTKETTQFIIILILLTAIATGLFIPPIQEAMAQSPITIILDGEALAFTESSGRPFIDANNRTLVPFRIALESFGAQVYWNHQSRIATAWKDGTIVEVPIGQPHIFVNGQLTPNDTEAVIASDGRTYLPIRKVMEAFGARVLWDGGTQTVYIYSPLEPTSDIIPDEIPPEPAAPDDLYTTDEQQLQRLAERLEENITFIRDPALFALYAFMNYTGYEEENNPEGFHSVRRVILQDLQRMDLQLTEPHYYRRKGLPYSNYIAALSEMDNQLQYRDPRKIEALLPELVDLDQRLREFVDQAAITNLYEKYQDEYRQAMAMYHPEMYEYLAKYTHFLRVPTRDVPEFSFLVNLQESYWRGYFLGKNYGPMDNGNVMVLGPSDELNYRLLAHEYLHSIITPIHLELREEIESLSYMMMQVPRGSQALNAVYNNWFTIFDESMIRALDSWFINTNQEEIVRQETETGFILTQYFYDRFQNDWEDFNGTLEDFIRQLIRDL